MADLDAFLAEAPGKSLYALLGVSHTSTIAELKKAYRRLCLWCHPDKTPHPRAADAFLLVCSAFELLSDPARRKAYDASLRPTIPKPAFAKPQYRPVPRYDAFSPNAGRGARWTEEQWRDAGNWPYDQRRTEPEPVRVRPRSAPPRRRGEGRRRGPRRDVLGLQRRVPAEAVEDGGGRRQARAFRREVGAAATDSITNIKR